MQLARGDQQNPNRACSGLPHSYEAHMNILYIIRVNFFLLIK